MHPQPRLVAHETEKEKNIVSCVTNQGGRDELCQIFFKATDHLPCFCLYHHQHYQVFYLTDV